MIIKFLICFLLVVVVYADLEAWQEWKKKYNKINILNPVSEKQRYEAFKANLKLIREHNRLHATNQTSYKLGLNEYSDRSESELFQIFDARANEFPRKFALKSSNKYIAKSRQKLDSINWAAQGYLPPVQSQGSKCGSCYAFATVGFILMMIFL